MRVQKWVPSLLGLFLGFVLLNLPAQSQTERIKRLYTNGEIEFESGNRVLLAGVRPTEEGLRLLAALLAGGQVDVERDDASIVAGATDRVYLKTTTRELAFPFANGEEPHQKTNSIQEFLLYHGAARVDNGRAFSRQAEFSKIEAEARAKGKGLWSYDFDETAASAPVSPA